MGTCLARRAACPHHLAVRVSIDAMFHDAIDASPSPFAYMPKDLNVLELNTAKEITRSAEQLAIHFLTSI